MIRAHKIALDPNNVQANYLLRAVGVARFAYNWALIEWGELYKAYKEDPSQPRPNEMLLRRRLNAIKREQFPWMLEVTKNAPQQSIINLGRAFNNFFKGNANYPKLKKKGINDSVTLSNDQFHLEGSHIHIPKLGLVRMRESLRFEGDIKSATISRKADKWFVSITVDVKDLPHTSENQGAVGIDLGLSTLATLSNGESFTSPKALSKMLKRLKYLSKSVSRKVKGSNNRNKARIKLQRLHARIVNTRQDFTHKMTSDIVRRFSIIGIEDLNVAGMLKSKWFSRNLSDMSFYEIRRQLTYKSELRGNLVVAANQFFPSSKTCSACNAVYNELSLSDRTWVCPSCNAIHNRDFNAAVNLEHYAVSYTVSAGGEVSSGTRLKTRTKLTSVKQESSSEVCTPLANFA